MRGNRKVSEGIGRYERGYEEKRNGKRKEREGVVKMEGQEIGGIGR